MHAHARRRVQAVVVRGGLVTVVVVLLAAMIDGGSAAVSAVLGGGIGVAGSVVFALLTAARQPSAADVVRALIRAEAAKITVIVLLLWLCFTLVRELVVVAFFGAFVVAVLVAGIANAVPDD